MKRKTLPLACAAALVGASSLAQAGLSANIGLTSNYLWRGITQTDDSAAISGGVDWNHDSGFYLGVWASNIDWALPSRKKGAEVDFYGGFSNTIQDFGYDIGVIHYYYPISGYENSNFTELGLTGTWKFLEAGINWTINGQAANGAPFDTGDIYYHLGASFEVMKGWTVGATVGRYDFKTSNAWDAANNHGASPDYTHFQIDLTKSAGDWGDFTFSVSQANTNFKSGAASNYWTNATDDAKFVVSWSKTFE